MNNDSRSRPKLKLKPWQPREWHDQRAVFDWARMMEPYYPALKLLHASMNGAQMKSAKQAMTAKLAGMRNGVPDMCLPVPQRSIDGNIIRTALYVEIKPKGTEKNPRGGLSVDQEWWLNALREAGAKAVVRYGSAAVIRTIAEYLHIPQGTVSAVLTATG